MIYTQCIPYRYFFKKKNTFRYNRVWNLFLNFHEDGLIIQGRSIYLMFLTFWLTYTKKTYKTTNAIYIYMFLPNYEDIHKSERICG